MKFLDYIAMDTGLKHKSRKFDLSKNKILFVFGIPILFFTFFFNFPISSAQDTVFDIYTDKNDYFTFRPPLDWKKEEIVVDTTSQVNFYSPDRKAILGIIAEFNEGDLNELFSQKKSYVEDYRLRFPKGNFSLSWVILGSRKVVKLDLEIPRVTKQEQYFFYDQGIRFDLVYGAENPADFKKYKQLALDAFATVQRQKQIEKR